MTQEFEKYTESGFGALHMGSQIDDPEAISICFGFKFNMVQFLLVDIQQLQLLLEKVTVHAANRANQHLSRPCWPTMSQP